MSAADPVPDRWIGLEGFDRLLEHRSRLGVCVLLGRSARMTFRHFKDLLEESDGNLGAHLKKLEDARYLKADKRFHGRKPVTWYRLTDVGRTALDGHLDAMERVIRETARLSESDS